jgi:hypothetical protein
MSFASGERELRGGMLSMLETHIVMSSLIFCLTFTLVSSSQERKLIPHCDD